MQVLADVVMPRMVLAAGVTGKQQRANTRTEAANGFVGVNIVRRRTKRSFELGTVPRSVEAWNAVEALFEVTDAGAYGFLMEDPKDCIADATAGVVLLSGGIYQLHKRYAVRGTARYLDRKITRPMTGVVLYADGAAVDGTVNVQTGQVTYGVPPSGALTWAGRFYTPVHFASDDLDWDIVSSGGYEQRLVVGPNVLLDEVLE